jgi:dTDP-4-amino-4,6-dideoxygalactose transaminase
VVLCDVADPADPLISTAEVEPLIGPRTKAVIAVHMWGYTADVVGLRELCDERGLTLIADAAQATGARLPDGRYVGSISDLGCFSFFSKKQLAIGEGGALTTDDTELADRLRRLRSHAMTSLTWERHRGHALGYDVTDIGFNYRMDEPRAALALSRLERLEDEIEERRRVARAYRERLADAEGIEVPFDDEAVERASHFVFPVLAEDGEARDAIRVDLQERGVQTTWYPTVHRLSVYSHLGDDASRPHSAEVADRHLCLPIFASLDERRIDLVCRRLREAVEVRLLQ